MDSIRRSFMVAAVLAAIVACTKQEPPSPPAEPAPADGGSSGVTYELAGTRWALMRLGDKEVKISEGGREAYIALNSADSSVVGFAGCNRIASTHEENGSQLHFGDVIATKMACEDMPTETALLEALQATTSWRITGSQLELLDAQQRSLATFEARNL
jgi:heat shock protein HslJ